MEPSPYAITEVRGSNSNFLYSFDIALPVLRKISIYCRWFLFGVSFYVNFQFTL